MSDRNRNDQGRIALENGYTPREWKRLNSMDKAEERKQRALIGLLLLLVAVTIFLIYGIYVVIFKSHDGALLFPFDKSSTVYGYDLGTADTALADSFARDLCVVIGDVNTDRIVMGALSAALFDVNNAETLYAKDIYTLRSPASMTKIMTALVALKYGNLDDMVVTTDTAKDIEYGSSVCDIKTGDTLSLKQLLYGMITASGNDAAMMVAEHVGGSVSGFIDMMNSEALKIGATRSHFTNPHGLTDPDHYSCVYDMYLIFMEAMRNDTFMDMISRKKYYCEYTNAEGGYVAVTWETTNHYLLGSEKAPDNVIVYGGKTGTTEDAGGCLTLLSKNLYGDPFISVIMHSDDKETVYTDMNALLSLVP